LALSKIFFEKYRFFKIVISRKEHIQHICLGEDRKSFSSDCDRKILLGLLDPGASEPAAGTSRKHNHKGRPALSKISRIIDRLW
jgi:hypothetical protein